jgi:hypothetical protein
MEQPLWRSSPERMPRANLARGHRSSPATGPG